MPLGRYVEKYELNGKSGSHSYGSISSGDAESQVMLPKRVSNKVQIILDYIKIKLKIALSKRDF